MIPRPTLLTAAIAGIVAGLAWRGLWPLLADPAASASMWLMLGMLAFVALPAHVGVVGVAPADGGGRRVDPALLKRTAVWIAAGAVTAFLASLY